jgi:hypothetical protein
MTHAGAMFGIPPQQPGSLLSPPVQRGEGTETVYGEYGPIVFKKEVKQESSSSDYDPSMPTEGDSPGKEISCQTLKE